MELADFLVAFPAEEPHLAQNFGPVIDCGKAAILVLHIRCCDRYFFCHFIEFGVIAAVWARNSHGCILIPPLESGLCDITDSPVPVSGPCQARFGPASDAAGP